MVCPFSVVVAAQRGFVGTRGPGGKAGRSKAALHRASGAELHKRVLTSAEASGLEGPARTGVIPTKEAVMCGATRKDTLSNPPRRRQERGKGDKDADRAVDATQPGAWCIIALGPDG
jgi:hypothetical protein